MAEEARDPGRDVPQGRQLRADRRARHLRRHLDHRARRAAGHPGRRTDYSTLLGTKYENDPVLGIVGARPRRLASTTVLRYYVGVLAATILVIATNAGLIGISRLSWSLAEHRQLPSVFARVHPRYRTPWFTIVFFSVLAALLLIPGKTDFLGNLYSFGAMLSFTTAHVGGRRAALQAARPRAPVPGAVERALPRRHASRSARCSARSARSPPGCRSSCCTCEARTVGIAWMVVGMARLLRLPPAPGPRPARAVQDRARPRARGLPRAGLPLGARADLRRPTSAPRAARGGASWSATDATVDARLLPRGAAAAVARRGRWRRRSAGARCSRRPACARASARAEGPHRA